MTSQDEKPAGWTGEELDRLRALEAQGLPIAAIAEQLGRMAADVRDRLKLIHADSDLPSYGPDEEGDVPAPRGARMDDPAAWVHIDPPPE